MALVRAVTLRRIGLIARALAEQGIAFEVVCATTNETAKPGIALWRWVLNTNAPVPVLLDHSLYVGNEATDELFARRVEIPYQDHKAVAKQSNRIKSN